MKCAERYLSGEMTNEHFDSGRSTWDGRPLIRNNLGGSNVCSSPIETSE